MNIIYISQFDFHGPAERYFYYLANELARRGHKVCFFIYGSPDSSKDYAEPALFHIERYYYNFGGGIPDKLKRIYTTFEPDIVHSFNPRYRLLNFAHRIQQDTKAKLFVHQEDNEELLLHKWKTCKQYRYKYLIGNMLKKWIPHKWPIYDPDFFKSILKDIDGMDCLSPLIERRVKEQFPDIPTKAIFFPVDLEYYKPIDDNRRVPNKDRDFIIHYGGTITPHIYDDFLMLLKAFSICRKRGLNNLRLVQTGGHIPKIRKALFEDLNDLGISEVVEIKPFLSPQEHKNELDRADIFVQPGKNDDVNRYRLPSKMFIYMAMGKPIVSFSVGIGELLSDDFILKTYTDSPEELAEKIIMLCKDKELCRILSINIRKKAEEWFSIDKVADQHLDFYRTIFSHTKQFHEDNRLIIES